MLIFVVNGMEWVCTVVGQDVVGGGAFVTGVSQLSWRACTGRAAVPSSLDECSADQLQCCELTHSRNTLLSNQNHLGFSENKKFLAVDVDVFFLDVYLTVAL